jgi:hypothetical protein
MPVNNHVMKTHLALPRCILSYRMSTTQEPAQTLDVPKIISKQSLDVPPIQRFEVATRHRRRGSIPIGVTVSARYCRKTLSCSP